MILATLAASVVWGESGLLARRHLAERLDRSNQDLAAIERENQRLIRDLRLMEQDPAVLERLVAEELGWAREGTTLYRFEDVGE
jgi:cell division protein FtsB